MLCYCTPYHRWELATKEPGAGGGLLLPLPLPPTSYLFSYSLYTSSFAYVQIRWVAKESEPKGGRVLSSIYSLPVAVSMDHQTMWRFYVTRAIHETSGLKHPCEALSSGLDFLQSLLCVKEALRPPPFLRHPSFRSKGFFFRFPNQ